MQQILKPKTAHFFYLLNFFTTIYFLVCFLLASLSLIYLSFQGPIQDRLGSYLNGNRFADGTQLVMVNRCVRGWLREDSEGRDLGFVVRFCCVVAQESVKGL